MHAVSACSGVRRVGAHKLGLGHPTMPPTASHADVAQVEGETTKSGAPKETFGTGSESQSEAGTKGGEISGARRARKSYVGN